MKHGCAISVVALIVLMLTMVATCPKASAHKEVLTMALQEAVDEGMDSATENDLFGSVLKAMGQLTVGTTAKYVVDSMVRVDDYYFFSVGRLKYGNSERIVSIGLFNHVFAPDKDDLLEVAGRYGI